ncbi:MAG: FAD:protein FMN transferase, partial [Marmoricola sp.]
MTTTLPSHEWDLWSTTARLVVTDPARLDEARDIAQHLLARIEAAASRFRSDSELLTLRRDTDGGCALSPELADLVREALRAAELSDGAVDPTVGSALADL